MVCIILTFTKLYNKMILICLCLNKWLRNTLLCQHEGQVSSSHVCHCVTENSLLLLHNYIFIGRVKAMLGRYLHVSESMYHTYVCLLHDCTTLCSYQKMHLKSPALSRLMNHRQVPEGKHVHCHMSSSLMVVFGVNHML